MPTCHCCQSNDVKKSGSYQNKNRVVQRFFCLRCGKSFSESQLLDGLRVDFKQAAQVVHLLCEGKDAARSKHTFTSASMVQISDLCSYALRRYLENKEDALFDSIFVRADKLAEKPGKPEAVIGVRHFTPAGCKCKICSAFKSLVTR